MHAHAGCVADPWASNYNFVELIPCAQDGLVPKPRRHGCTLQGLCSSIDVHLLCCVCCRVNPCNMNPVQQRRCLSIHVHVGTPIAWSVPHYSIVVPIYSECLPVTARIRCYPLKNIVGHIVAGALYCPLDPDSPREIPAPEVNGIGSGKG